MGYASETGKGRTVAVYGAAGHTGRFVVAELKRRGLTPVAIGRDRGKLAAALGQGIEARVAALADEASLDRALAGSAAVINCAGPFLDSADAVARAALRAGIHYLDVTAEQPSARATLETFDAPARAAGVAVMPAMGFYGGFADLLVTAALGDWDSPDAIDIAIGLDSWHPTQGTRLTGERNTARRVVVSGGKLAPVSLPAATKEWEFAAPLGPQTIVEVPLSEIILIARHVKVGELHTWLSELGLADIRDAKTPPPKPADASGRSAQRFAVEVVARRGSERRRIVAQGRDIYAFSAPLVCEAVERLLAGTFARPGASAPGEIFDAKDFLTALTPECLTLDTCAG
jgi:short subunit dehydrogenase-like uncharacterized protein